MGWNSWNVWGTSVDDAKVRAAADGWSTADSPRTATSTSTSTTPGKARAPRTDEILTNEKFPDMKGLADYVHSHGLKLGIYSSPGPEDLRRVRGVATSTRHQDAQTWADWGIDLLKYDWCSYGGSRRTAAARSIGSRTR